MMVSGFTTRCGGHNWSGSTTWTHVVQARNQLEVNAAFCLSIMYTGLVQVRGLTCAASSRVGDRIRTYVAATCRGLYSNRSRIGSVNAAVLPLPVTALPQMSRPASAKGIQAACGPQPSTSRSTDS